MIDVFLSLKTNQGKICLRKKLVYDTYNLDFKNKDEATKIKSNFYYEIENWYCRTAQYWESYHF